ncbi:hypothetical protein BASA81_003605 [Batrachochytrium salamandrivorans]|nr:hypothetical protein BASA81_003605 [Batrachochytrium salamandrivorans]
MKGWLGLVLALFALEASATPLGPAASAPSDILMFCNAPAAGCTSLTPNLKTLDCTSSGEFPGCQLGKTNTTCADKPLCVSNQRFCSWKSITMDVTTRLLPGCLGDTGNLADCELQRQRAYNSLEITQVCDGPASPKPLTALPQATRAPTKAVEQFDLELYVSSVLGVDSLANLGRTRTSPFQTLDYALVRSREVSQASRKRITLLAGTHRIVNTVEITPRDSNLVIEGETGNGPVVVSGSQLVDNPKNWSVYSGATLVMDLTPRVAAQLGTLSALFLDGRPMVRARFPNVDTFGQSKYANYGLRTWKVRPNPTEGITNRFQVQIGSTASIYSKFYSAENGRCAGQFSPPVGYFCEPNNEAQGGCLYSIPGSVSIGSNPGNQLSASKWATEPQSVYMHVFHPYKWGLWTFDVAAQDTSAQPLSADYGAMDLVDLRAWQTLYLSTKGDGWLACTGAMAFNNPCSACAFAPTFQYVTCKANSQGKMEIVEIVLRGNALQGKLVISAINSLTGLRKLDVSNPVGGNQTNVLSGVECLELSQCLSGAISCNFTGSGARLCTPQPTKSPSASPTNTPTKQPTTLPTQSPSHTPTTSPTKLPTRLPTLLPTRSPSTLPTQSPTQKPTLTPTQLPTKRPTLLPTQLPTKAPTPLPTTLPTKSPTQTPTKLPTPLPTTLPTKSPTQTPTLLPTQKPTLTPTQSPTQQPTLQPTQLPTTQLPSQSPTTSGPSMSPTMHPTKSPTSKPTKRITKAPTKRPTKRATDAPTKRKTRSPTKRKTRSPTLPTKAPTKRPTTLYPTRKPTRAPTKRPTKVGFIYPTKRATNSPTKKPRPEGFIYPTKRTTLAPTKRPTRPTPLAPSTSPSMVPSPSPSLVPSLVPSRLPTLQPSRLPTLAPTLMPTSTPTLTPITGEMISPGDDATSSPTSNPLQGSARKKLNRRLRRRKLQTADVVLNLRRGGFQEARGDCAAGGGKEWYVENSFYLLDKAGEFFLDVVNLKLYVIPFADQTVNASTLVELTSTRTLIKAQGLSSANSVRNFKLRNLRFEQTFATHMDAAHEVPSGGDWTITRQAAVLLENVISTEVTNCQFRFLGGNGILVSRFARFVDIYRNDFQSLGSTAVLLVGDPLFASSDPYDRRVHTTNHVELVSVRENVMSELGLAVKQSSGIFIAISKSIMMERNVIFDCARAAITYNDAFGGNNTASKNVVFHTVLETEDHGPFNSWDRQQWLEPAGKLAMEVNDNIFYGTELGPKGIDLDDGVRSWNVRRNVVFDGLLKLKGSDIYYEDNLLFPISIGCYLMTPINLPKGANNMRLINNVCIALSNSIPPYNFNVASADAATMCLKKNFVATGNSYYGTSTSWSGCGRVIMNWALWTGTFALDQQSTFSVNKQPTLAEQNDMIIAKLNWLYPSKLVPTSNRTTL